MDEKKKFVTIEMTLKYVVKIVFGIFLKYKNFITVHNFSFVFFVIAERMKNLQLIKNILKLSNHQYFNQYYFKIRCKNCI